MQFILSVRITRKQKEAVEFNCVNWVKKRFTVVKDSSNKNFKYIIASVLLSTIVHFFLLAIFMQIRISPDMLRLPDKKIPRRLKLIRRKKETVKKTIKKSATVPGVEKIELSPNIPETTNLPDTGINFGKKDGENHDLPKSDNIPAPPEDPVLPEIVSVDGDSFSAERTKFNHNLIPKLPKLKGITEFLLNPSIGKRIIPTIPPNMRLSPPPKKYSEDPAMLPVTPETRLLPCQGVQSMDSLLDVKLYKFPLPDGNGFFRIDLSPNAKAATLRTFRKDVIFLLDVSGSIGRIRLEEFKTGLFRTLKTFHPEDRFNIIGFRSGNIPLFTKPVYPTKENIKKADHFLFKMRHSGSTNIYSALKLYSGKNHRTANRPLILFLLSDGKVNYGEIISDREVINVISNRNHEGAAIYSFSCGRSKNSFLMDLISYRNRGESLYIKITDNSNIPLSRFICNVADVKVVDLEYQVSSNLSYNTFPKRLPNLHKGKTLSVYGRYPAGTDNIGLRITGMDSSGIRREIVFGGRLSDAELTGDDLPKKWAEQYIYHLYSMITVEYKDSLKQEILRTAKHFKLNLPYLNEHLAPAKQNYVE